MQPETTDELVAAVSDVRADGGAVELRGGGSVLDRLPANDVPILSTSAIRGIVAHAAEDLTITVRAGTPLDELDEALAEHGQECPIEPIAGAGSTVGGRIATGLAGPRQLSAGRVRDWLLRVRFVAGTGQHVMAGGVTVKDVTGYDLCRLVTGSWGTIGVITEVTLKLRPLARHRAWFATTEPRPDLDAQLFRPAALFTASTGTHVLLEGHPDDAAAQAELAGLEPATAPDLPVGARASVDPADLGALRSALRELDVEVVTQDAVGVGYLDAPATRLPDIRQVCEGLGGTLLVLDPESQLPAFGPGAAPDAMTERMTAALDPGGVFAPWRWQR